MKLDVYIDEPLTYLKTMVFESMPELDSKIIVDGEIYFVHRVNPREISLRKPEETE